jgi:hypothetical protein
MSEDDSKDDPTSDCCPFCKDEECKIHLLARFDKSGDEGDFGVGLVGGPLSYVNEIGEVLDRARLAWVQSVRAAGKPKAPRWIMKEPGLRDYFDALENPGGFDLEEYENDEDAADDLQANTDAGNWHAREDFLYEVLSSCGLGGLRTEEDFDALMRSTTYLSWWAPKPREIVEKFTAKLRRMLLEGNREKLRNDAAAARARAALEALRPNEPPLGDLTADEQSWLAIAFAHLNRIYEKREEGSPGNGAFCVFAVGKAYVQFLALWDAEKLLCETVSAKFDPEIATVLKLGGDEALRTLGFKAPEISPNYSLRQSKLKTSKISLMLLASPFAY